VYVRAIVVVAAAIVLAINRLWIPAVAFVALAVMVLVLSSLGRNDRMG
jgi:hypothetical protein